MGVSVDKMVTLTITNVEDAVTSHSVQIHPQKPEHGMRVMYRHRRVLLDQCDASTYKIGEEITLLRWGNITITNIETAAAEGDSTVLSMTVRIQYNTAHSSSVK